MSSVSRPMRIVGIDPFHVVLNASGAREPVVVHTAGDADQASVAFHVARQRLTREQVTGDLVLVQHGDEPRTLLWESLR